MVKDPAIFNAQYPDFTGVIAGEFIDGSLNNAGERIRLEDAAGQTILDFAYSDTWYPTTDGGGPSLVIINPADPDPNSWGEMASWSPSYSDGGSPGKADENEVTDVNMWRLY